MSRNGEPSFGDIVRGVASIKLPQQVRKESIHHPAAGLLSLELVLVSLEPAPFGRNLSCTYILRAKCQVPDKLIAGMGYHAQRLRRLGLVPEWVPIIETKVIKELTDADTEKKETELFQKFKLWLTKQKVEAKVIAHLKERIQKGSVSRFSIESAGEESQRHKKS